MSILGGEPPLVVTPAVIGSEVAQIIALIDLQTEAMIRGLKGFAETARHDTIEARFEAVIAPYLPAIVAANNAATQSAPPT